MTARMRMQVASYMRAVLRTLAQCHSHHILHRDIKPGGCTPQHLHCLWKPTSSMCYAYE